MATAIPKDEFRTIISDISELPEAFIVWDGEPKRPVDYGTGAKRLVLNPTARRRVGEDEEKREYVSDPDNLPDGLLVKTTFSGQRSVTISMRAENFGAEEGFDFLELIRTMLGADETRLALNELEMSLARITDIQTFPVTAGNRTISVASMDVILNHHVERVITKSGDTYIERVEGEAQMAT